MSSASPPSDQIERVGATLRAAAHTVSEHLNAERLNTRRLGGDPVRLKNLERVSGQLHDLIAMLDADPPPVEGLASLETVLAALKKPEKLSMQGAWEVADALEIESIRLASPMRLLVLLESYETKRVSYWSPRFPADELKGLIHDLRSGIATAPVVEEARERLIELEKIRINGYRRDRALVEQKALYLRRMSLVLLIALGLLGWLLASTLGGLGELSGESNTRDDTTPMARRPATRTDTVGVDSLRLAVLRIAAARGDTVRRDTIRRDTFPRGDTASIRLALRLGVDSGSASDTAKPDSANPSETAQVPGKDLWRLLLLAALAGTVGSILSRAIRLGGRQAFAGVAESSPENATPLGVRAQLAAWQLFMSQVAVGTAAGVLIFIILKSGLIEISALELDNALHVVVLALLAGFSERFFLGTLDDLVGRFAGMSRPPPDRLPTPSREPTSPP